MPAYLLEHWRGHHSLGRSMWINGALVAVVLLAIMLALAWPTGLGFDGSLWAATGWALVAVAVTVWHAVGQWRSATRLLDRGGSAVATGVGCVGMVPAWLIVWLLAAAIFVAGLEARLGRKAETDAVWRDPAGIVRLAGFSPPLEEILGALDAGPVKELRIGALLLDDDEVVALVRRIQAQGLTVVASGFCNAACFTLLVASPRATVTPGILLMLDRKAVSAWASDAEKAEREQFYRGLGLDDDALRELREKGTWTPSLGKAIAMGLIDQIRAYIDADPVPAPRWCEVQPEDCLVDSPPADAGPMPPLFYPPPKLPGLTFT